MRDTEAVVGMAFVTFLHPTRDRWAIGDPPGKLPLYHLHETLAVETVYVCEGEKCVDGCP